MSSFIRRTGGFPLLYLLQLPSCASSRKFMQRREFSHGRPTPYSASADPISFRQIGILNEKILVSKTFQNLEHSIPKILFSCSCLGWATMRSTADNFIDHNSGRSTLKKQALPGSPMFHFGENEQLLEIYTNRFFYRIFDSSRKKDIQ